MKYDIEVDGYQKEVEVRSDEDGYHVTIDGVVYDVQLTKNQGSRLFLRMGAKSMTIEHAFCHDMQEIHYKGQRHVASVMDPRKKVLQLASAVGGDTIVTQMPGRVISIRVAVGEAVQKGQVLATVEAMKMENPLKAPRDGIVAEICASEGEVLEAKGMLIRLESE